MSGDPLRVGVYSESVCERLRPRELAESVEYLSPDVVIISVPYHRPMIRNHVSSDVPILNPGDHTGLWVQNTSDSRLVMIGSVNELSELAALEESGRLHPETETFVLSDLLSVEIDLTRLETTLRGRDRYEAALASSGGSGSYTHLTMTAQPDYQNDWGRLRVRGVAPGADGTGAGSNSELALLKLHRDGVVSSRTLDVRRFGLQALEGVGPSRAETLREAGLVSRVDVAKASHDELRRVEGFGLKTAQTVRASALALETGEVYRRSGTAALRTDPVFIDIETDGLSPTIVWLIGVLDSSSDRYLAFRTQDPEAKGKAIEHFMMWYTANAAGRPLVAYHGEGFDFPVLKDQIQQHCPQYVEAWEDAWKFDPYWWAVKRGNAVLPGRTNQLADVAEGLGWESAETGLTGGTVAQVIQRWLANPCDETEPDWETHETYCEDDVRSLAHVFDELADAEQLDGTMGAESRTDDAERTTQTAQGTLSDF